MVAVIPVVLIGLYLPSFSSLGGGLENAFLFVFILWVGFGSLAGYFLGLLMIAILRNKKSEK
jgi:hypothetical protein